MNAVYQFIKKKGSIGINKWVNHLYIYFIFDTIVTLGKKNSVFPDKGDISC